MKLSLLRSRFMIAATLMLCCWLPSMSGQAVGPQISQNAVPALRLRAATKAPAEIPMALPPIVSARFGQDNAGYHGGWNDGVARLSNPAQSLKANFTSRGVAITAGQDEWKMAVTEFGYRGRMVAVNAVAPKVKANRVEYQRGPLTEWYVNGPLGIEQGFTVAKTPLKSAQFSASEPLTISLSLAGNLTASVDGDGRGLTLSRKGKRVLRYGGLRVTDARGRELLSWVELVGDRLLLRANDLTATYPLTIDPLVEAAKLTITDGPVPYLGTSVAISSDGKTVVVASPQSLFNATPLGAAYVFVESSDGWNDATQVAKLTASDGASNDFFASYSVAISGNGNVIVVGAPGATIGSNTRQGAAYVFFKPSNGWVNSTETYKVTSSDGQTGSFFSTAIAVDNTGFTLVLTSRFPGVTDFLGDYSGKAYVFLRTKTDQGLGGYHQVAALTNSNRNDSCYDDPNHFCDEFGNFAAISKDGQTIAVGGGGFVPGVAYVYLRPGTGWADATETAQLQPSDFAFQYGILAMDDAGNTIAVGALQAPYPKGAVYIYTKPEGGWFSAPWFTETAKLTANTNHFFGAPVAISGDGKTVASEAYVGIGEDGVFLYLKPDTGWVSATENAVFPVAPYESSGIALNGVGNALVIGRHDLNLTYVYTDSALSNFTVSPIDPLTLGIAESGSSTIKVNSFNGFNSAVSFSTSSVPLGVTVTASSVTPAAGGSATVPLNVTIGPAAAQGTYNFDVTGTSGSLSHTVSVSLTIVITPAGLTNVVNQELALGCIDSSGVTNALLVKLAQAQAFITAGDIQSAINTLTALLHQLQAQSGKHVAATCTDQNGNTIDLIADVQSLLANLGANTIKPNPILGFALNGSGLGVAGATVTVLDSSKRVIASTSTDSTGFYYFAKTSVFLPGTTYTISVTPPKPYKKATVPTFKWSGVEVDANLLLN